MNSDERLLLQKMIKANDVSDQTELIRRLKHSHMLEEDINKLLKMKKEEASDDEIMNECSFLFTQYTDIYNKIKKNELDLSILNRFLNVLRSIEDSEIDQHEGSYVVGNLLKQLYIDSALRKSAKLNNDNTNNNDDTSDTYAKIGYREYRKKYMSSV